jgi:LPS O-antigen subunit length determinant protein (WzzB/FepE family)
MAELALQRLEEEAKVISAEMEGEISAAQAWLVDLREQEELIKEIIERLNVSERLVNDQIDEIRDVNRNALENRVRAVEQVQDPANAMTLLMIDSEIQQNRNRLANLEERLMVELPNQRNEFQIRLEENRRSQITEGLRVDALKARSDQRQADNRREQELQATELVSSKFQLDGFEIEWERDRAHQLQVVRELEARLEGTRETQIIAGPSRHLKVEGPGKAVILALSMVLGLMFGVFMAFFTQFLTIAGREPEPEG